MSTTMKTRYLNCKPNEKRALKLFTNFAGETMFGKRLAKHISLSMSFTKLKDTDGSCAVHDEKKYPRKFLIHISSDLDLEGKLQTLGHEVAHAKQFARRELVYDYLGTWWHDKFYEDESVHYYREPWEIEAFGEGYCLMRLFYESYPEFKPKKKRGRKPKKG